MGRDSSHAENQNMSHSQTTPLAQALSGERSCEDQNLARDVNTKTPAKPGSNYLCSGSQGELFRLALTTPTTYGVWGYGDTLEAYFSSSLPGCLDPLSPFHTKHVLFCEMHVSLPVTLASLMFTQSELSVQPQALAGENLSPKMHI